MTRIHLATGLAVRGTGDGRRVLLTASRYANHDRPLWNLPGGRQQAGELLAETAQREALEETGLRAWAGELAYLSESYDGATHFLNATFHLQPCDASEVEAIAIPPVGEDHVVDAAWVPIGELAERIVVAVVREPLLAYLQGELHRRYAGFHASGVTIQWPPGSS